MNQQQKVGQDVAVRAVGDKSQREQQIEAKILNQSPKMKTLATGLKSQGGAQARIMTGLLVALYLVAFLAPGFHFAWVPVVGMALIFAFASLELYQAIGRRLYPMYLLPMVVGTLLGLLPCLVWIWYHDLSGWQNISLRTVTLSPAMLSNNAWLTVMNWMLGLGIALYAVVFLLYAFLVQMIQLLLQGPAALPSAVASTSASATLSFPLACVCLFMFAIPNGWRWLVLIVLLSSLTDMTAYYAGRFWGKRAVVPKLSPTKTFAGTVAALAMSAVVSALFFVLFLRGNLPQFEGVGINLVFGIFFGLLVGLAIQMGDWLCSAIKRWCELKDFSKTLPGHGGVLDRFDSLIAALPVGLLLAFFYYMIEH